jgi:hypothetical protein
VRDVWNHELMAGLWQGAIARMLKQQADSPLAKLLAAERAKRPPPTHRQKVAWKIKDMRRRIRNAEAALRGEWEAIDD